MTGGPWEQFQTSASLAPTPQPESGPWTQFQGPSVSLGASGQASGPRAASGLWEAAEAGWQGSATGLAVRGKLPDVVLDPQHSKWLERLTSTAASTVSELPEMVAGGAAAGLAGLETGPGAIVAAGAGAFALPTAIRTALTQAYSKGAVTSAGDFLNRTAITGWETAKSAAVGGLTAGVGLAAKPLGALASAGAEIGTMTTASAALQGKLPEPEDFLNAAIMVGGMHAAGMVAGRMRDVYTKTGITPEQQVADATKDPAVAEALKAPAEPGEAPTPVLGVEAAVLPETPAHPVDVPAPYRPASDAQAIQDAVPGLAQQVAPEFFGPHVHITDEPAPTQVNYQYLNTPSQVDGAMMKISEINEAAIQTQRRGTVANAQTELEAKAALMDMLGAGSDAPLRTIGTASNASQLLAMKQLTEGAANEMGMEARRYAELGTNASPEDTARFLGAIDRCALIQSQFLGARAEAGRALQILQDTTDHGAANARMQMIQDAMAKFKGDPKELAAKLTSIDSAEGAARFAREATKGATWQRVMEAWKAGLLGPVTVVKKGLSDITMLASRPIIDTVAYGFNRLSGSSERMSAAEPIARMVANTQGVKEGLVQAWETLKSEWAQSAPGGITESSGAIPGVVGQLIRTPFSALKAVTEMFSAIEQRGEAGAMGARQAAAEGLSPATHEFWDRVGELSTNPPESDLDQIQKFGERMTFNAELGTTGKAFQKMVGSNKALQLVFPFTKIPANVLKESTRISPFAPLVGEWRSDFAEGGISRNKAMAEMAVGTAIGTLALSLAAAGKISGSGDPDPAKRRVQQAGGWQPNSINIGGKWYSVGMIHPIGTLLGMAADIHDMHDRMEAGEQDQAIKTLQNAFSHAVTQQSFLQGMTNVVHALDAPEKQGAVFMQNLAASVVPATVTQLSAMIHGDPYKRQIDSIKDAVEARIPGLREGLTAQRDPYGEPIPNDDRLLGVSPIVAKAQSEDLVRTEAARLGVGAQAAPHNINLPADHMQGVGKVELDPQQRDRFGDVSGHLAYQVMDSMVRNPLWAHVPDEIKRQMMEKAFEHGDAVAKATVLSPEERQQEILRITGEISKRLSVVK